MISDNKGELRGEKESILFVDDEEQIVTVMNKLLKILGYNVTAKTSSLEALELFQNNPDDFDLILTDMTMPEMTGEELTREVLKISPEIPVVLCTGFSHNINEKKAKAMGVSAFVLKPVSLKELGETIRKSLDNI